jgi:hypothetical protein
MFVLVQDNTEVGQQLQRKAAGDSEEPGLHYRKQQAGILIFFTGPTKPAAWWVAVGPLKLPGLICVQHYLHFAHSFMAFCSISPFYLQS